MPMILWSLEKTYVLRKLPAWRVARGVGIVVGVRTNRNA